MEEHFFLSESVGMQLNVMGYAADLLIEDGNLKNWDIEAAMATGFWGGVSGDCIGSGVEIVGQAAGIGTIGQLGISAGAHATWQGTMATMQGGDFWEGFVMGFASSITSSAVLGTVKSSTSLSPLAKVAITVSFSAHVSASVAEANGGHYWEGLATGAIIAACNHAPHALGAVEPVVKDEEVKGSVPVNIKKSNNPVEDIFFRIRFLKSKIIAAGSGEIKDITEIVELLGGTGYNSYSEAVYADVEYEGKKYTVKIQTPCSA